MIGSSGKPRLVCIVNRPVISRQILGVFPLDQIAHVGVSSSISLELSVPACLRPLGLVSPRCKPVRYLSLHYTHRSLLNGST